jgi:NADH-quinone oxidoreductase subunit J
LLAELVMVFQTWQMSPALLKKEISLHNAEGVTNTEAIGQVLYTHYIYIFQGAGLILLVAMIGAIVLTLRERSGVKRQNVAEQQARKVSDVLEIKKVTPGSGI